MSAALPGQAATVPAQAAGDGLVIDTTTQAFAKDVIEESRKRPVLVDFWAPWCGPCRTLSPIIEKVVRAAKGAVRLVKMDIDQHPAVAGQLGIQSIPAVIAFVNGQPVDGFIGAVPEGQIKAFVDRILGQMKPPGPSDAEKFIADAEALLTGGEAAAAAEGFAAALKSDPGSVPATVGLARAHLAGGDLETARQTLAMLPDTAKNDPRVAAARAQIELAGQSAAVGDTAALAARADADPNDLDARFDLALALNASGDREAATDRLLEIMRKNRSWNEEKARKQLLQFFEAWGPTDAATISGRRRLSSLLFA
jgi:putative thioredoxin